MMYADYSGAAPLLTVFGLDNSYNGAVSVSGSLIYSTNLAVDAGSSLSLTSANVGVFVVPVNDAPAITLNSIITSYPENSSTTSAIDVADVVVTDLDGGANNLSLSGAHAAYIQLSGIKLQIKPGMVLDTESVPHLSVSVNVDDSSVEAGIDSSAAYTLILDNVDESPVLGSIETDDINFVENDVPLTISSMLLIFDPLPILRNNGEDENGENEEKVSDSDKVEAIFGQASKTAHNIDMLFHDD